MKIKTEQKLLAEKIKIMKIQDNDFSYKELAEMIDMNINSFYCWLNNQFNMKTEKFNLLEDWYYTRKDSQEDG